MFTCDKYQGVKKTGFVAFDSFEAARDYYFAQIRAMVADRAPVYRQAAFEAIAAGYRAAMPSGGFSWSFCCGSQSIDLCELSA